MNKIIKFLKNIFMWTWKKARYLFSKIGFDKRTIEGGLAGLFISIVVFYFYLGADLQSGIGKLLDPIVGGILSIISLAGVAILSYFIIWLIKKISPLHLSIFIGMVFLTAWFWSISIEIVWPLVVTWVVISFWFGSAFVSIKNYQKLETSIIRFPLLVLNFLISGTLFFGSIYWFFYAGTDEHIIQIPVKNLTSQTNLPNPSLAGDFEFEYFTYGSGTDRWRDEYAEGARYITSSVNASSYYSLTDWETKTREFYWGFGSSKLPINGRVWMPKGDGKFPLVLIVHGNHDMNEYSDEGYRYLGEMLASQGFIFVSVDQNFFNGYWSGGVSGENDARAWVLLQHLVNWQNWNQDVESDLFGKIDMDQIVLAGHSRGGEAVALAATFNKLDRYPNNAKIAWDFNFNIRGVVAIAPTDQQHSPAGHANPISDINYLVIQGGHDADISSYYGFKQYQRISYSDPNSNYFKAGIYIYQANHGQFNTVWGDKDFSTPKGDLLNRKPLLAGAEQREILKVYLAAFVKITLANQNQYLPFFKDYRTGLDWLPDTLYINQYQAPSYSVIANFEEDVDVTTATYPGSQISTLSLFRWREEEVKFRKNRSSDNHGLILGWGTNGGKFSIDFQTELLTIDSNSVFTFLVADNRTDRGEKLLGFEIRFEDIYGNSILVNLSDYAEILPRLPVKFTKFYLWEDDKYRDESERVFSSVRIPMDSLLIKNLTFEQSSISKIEFSFGSGNTAGEIVLDEIGWEIEYP